MGPEGKNSEGFTKMYSLGTCLGLGRHLGGKVLWADTCRMGELAKPRRGEEVADVGVLGKSIINILP